MYAMAAAVIVTASDLTAGALFWFAGAGLLLEMAWFSAGFSTSGAVGFVALQ